jgi:hypothetical protein
VGIILLHRRGVIMRWDRHGLAPTIALDQSEHDHLARRAPATFFLPASRQFGVLASKGLYVVTSPGGKFYSPISMVRFSRNTCSNPAYGKG